MQEHWDAGNADMAHTLLDPRWINRPRGDRDGSGVRVFDLAEGSPSGARKLTAPSN